MPFRARPHEFAFFTHGLTVVLLTAFMLRALIPTGWMPQASTSGDGITLVICTVAGLQEITLGADGHKQPAGDIDQANAGHDPCPFAAVAKFTPPALTPLLVLPTDYGAVEPLRHTAETPAATHLLLAESRGPPVLI
jgi:DUF2946 family protein